MECSEAQKLIRDYMYGQLPADKKEDFVSHIRSCRDCYEELDIYYMVEVGLNGLRDDRLNNMDLKNRLEQELEDLETEVQQQRTNTFFRYSLLTLSYLAAGVIFLLQLRIWLLP